MTLGLVDKVGGWRSLLSGFIILSFLALAVLLAISGHSMHQFLAVVYLLVAAFVMTRLVPKPPIKENDLNTGTDFESGSDSSDQQCCCNSGDAGDTNNR